MRHRPMVPSPGGTHHPADQPARGVPDTSGSPLALVSCHGYGGKTVPGDELAEDARKNLPQHAAAQPEYALQSCTENVRTCRIARAKRGVICQRPWPFDRGIGACQTE